MPITRVQSAGFDPDEMTAGVRGMSTTESAKTLTIYQLILLTVFYGLTLPFFFVTTTWNSGQTVFFALLGMAALTSIVDPVYYRWLAARQLLFMALHTLALFAVLHALNTTVSTSAFNTHGSGLSADRNIFWSVAFRIFGPDETASNRLQAVYGDAGPGYLSLGTERVRFGQGWSAGALNAADPAPHRSTHRAGHRPRGTETALDGRGADAARADADERERLAMRTDVLLNASNQLNRRQTETSPRQTPDDGCVMATGCDRPAVRIGHQTTDHHLRSDSLGLPRLASCSNGLEVWSFRLYSRSAIISVYHRIGCPTGRSRSPIL